MLKDAVNAAILASGKSAAEIAAAQGIDANTISRIRTGEVVNPQVGTLIAIAHETGTTVGALLDEQPAPLSLDDEQELRTFREWIERKLATIDARAHPNAEEFPAPLQAAAKQVADRLRASGDIPFAADADFTMRALGDSMIGAGIVDGDRLYLVTYEETQAPPIGRIVACRIGGALFVKRLSTAKGHLLLLSADPRYRPIVVDEPYEILGIVIGRVGRLP